MWHAPGDADPKNAEAGFFLHKSHNGKTECSPGEAVEDTEQISKHKPDHNDPYSGDKCRFLPRIFFKDKKYRKVRKSKLHPRDPRKKRDQRFHIAKDDRNCGKQP